MTEHRLVNNTLVREADGIVARCTCGWESPGHFTSASASADFRDHQERKMGPEEDEPDGDDYADRAEQKARL